MKYNKVGRSRQLNFHLLLIFVILNWQEAGSCLLCSQRKFSKLSFDTGNFFDPLPRLPTRSDRMKLGSNDFKKVAVNLNSELYEGTPMHSMKEGKQQLFLLNQKQVYQVYEEQQYHSKLQIKNDSEDDDDSDNDSRKKIKDVMVSMIRWYKNSLSPIMPPNCRFLPTCSTYAIESLDKYGPYRYVWSIF